MIQNKEVLEQIREEAVKELNSYDCRILVCSGTGCVATGSQKIYEKFLEIAKDAPGVSIEFGPHDKDAHVGVKKPGCQGVCELGPLVRIQKGDDVIQYTKVQIEDCQEIFEKSVQGNETIERLLYQKADEIIAFYGKKPASLIPIMQDIQGVYRYLPEELLTYVAEQIGVTEAKAFSVATFYENFSFDAKGKYVIKVCDGTACHVRKSIPVLEELYKKLGLSKTKKTTDDMMFTVETVSCLGACGLAPTMMVNDDVHPRMTPEKADELIDKLRGGEQG